MGILKKVWEWVSHGDTVWGIMNTLFPTLLGSGGGVSAWFSSYSPVLIFFSIVGGIAGGLFVSNQIAARRLMRKFGLPLKEKSGKTTNWLEQELSSDIKRVREGMRGRAIQWNFSGIYNRDHYFEIFVELTNTTIFTFDLKGVEEGFMKIEGEECVNSSPHVHPHFNIKRDKTEVMHLTQAITSETAKLIQESGNDNKELSFDLREVVFRIENTTEGYEKYKPRMTGGIYNIVPKDGLKIEDK